MITTEKKLTRKPMAHQAEPVWEVLDAQHGGEWDAWAKVYCDIQTGDTVVQTVGDYVWGTDPDSADSTDSCWVAYVWDSEGLAWEVGYGLPEDVECRWWELDDFVWGFMETYVFAYLNTESVRMSPEEIVRYCAEAGMLPWKAHAREAVEVLWSALTPEQEVRLGLTEAEIQEEQDEIDRRFGPRGPRRPV